MVRATLAFFSLLLMVDPPSPARFDLAIRHARVVHGDGRITPHATVFIAGGRIERIDSTDAADTVPAERNVEASGRTLLPGLIDAHVHVEPWTLPLFLKYGVTSVRDVHNDPSYIFPLVRGEGPVGPRVVAAGALLDGPGSFWKNALVVTDMASARAAVRSEVEAGAGVIKIYTRLRPAAVAEIVLEARARGVPVAAHLGKTTATEAAMLGVTSIEHLTGIAESASSDPDRLRALHDDFFAGWTASELEWPLLTSASLDRVARALIERHVVLVPTLALHEAFSRLLDRDLMNDPALRDVPRDVVEKSWDPRDIMTRAKWTDATLAGFKRTLPVLQRFVARYRQLGGRIAAGTDTPQQFVIPGVSLHRELELYVAGGMSPAAAIRAATADAADLLGSADRTGTVDVGKDADLILVDGDPLGDISVLDRLALVLVRGVRPH
jgi:imidazolonepropionase-like amidohydrolase